MKFQHRYITIALLLAPSLLSTQAFAQVSKLNPITINATRVEKSADEIPAAISVVGQDKLQLGSEQLGLDESLRIPGLFSLNRYNFAQDLRLSIRGFGARSRFGIRGIKIIVDGIPETLADGQGSVDGVDIGSARQVTVIRGPASALYGNASGGAILIETEKGDGLPFAEFRLTAGEFGYRKPQVKLGGGGSGKLNYLLNISDTSIDGYRDHSEFENTQMNARIDYSLSDSSSLLTTIHHTDQPVANDPGGINAADLEANPEQAFSRNLSFDAGESLKQTRIGMLYKTKISEGRELQARVYHTQKDFKGKLPLVSFPGPDGVGDAGTIFLDRNFLGGGIKYIIENELGSKQNRLLVGFDYDNQDDDRRRFDNLSGSIGLPRLDQNELVTSIGTFIQNETKLNEELELTLGLRYDNVEFDVSDAFLSDGDDTGKIKFTETSPSIGLRFKQSNNTHLYTSISKSFETPTTTEFANPNGGGFNQALDSQKATNYEIGIKTHTNDYRFEAALFHIDIKDELTPFELANDETTYYTNAGSTKRDGVELSYTRQLTQQFVLATSYTYSDFVYEKYTNENGDVLDGKKAPGIPDHQLHLDLSWYGESGLYTTLNNTYTSALFADNANETEVESYVVSDLRVGYNGFYKGWDVESFIGVNNLLDESYNSNIRINAFGQRYFEAAPERNLIVGITVRMMLSE